MQLTFDLIVVFRDQQVEAITMQKLLMERIIQIQTNSINSVNFLQIIDSIFQNYSKNSLLITYHSLNVHCTLCLNQECQHMIKLFIMQLLLFIRYEQFERMKIMKYSNLIFLFLISILQFFYSYSYCDHLIFYLIILFIPYLHLHLKMDKEIKELEMKMVIQNEMYFYLDIKILIICY